MKIGIIGTGNVGFALAEGFLKYGHEVKLGTRDTSQQKVQQWNKEHKKAATIGSFAEAAQFGDVIILATPWTGTHNAIKLAGEENFAGKIVIDPTNPLDFSGGTPPRMSIGQTDSAGESVQRWLPDALVVKAWNIIGSSHMVDPDFDAGPPDMFICGNDATAKKQVTQFLTDFGWNTIDLGEIGYARFLEPLAMIWIVYGFKTESWNHAFKLLRK
jgi:predicted dinucleotide-binding enzyme